MTQATALIDGNNFYAACEQNIDPSLSGRPVVVLSNNDGCIVARSSEARKLGISMGQPYFKIQHKLKKLGVVVRSSNYALYGDMSQRLMGLLKKHCEHIEIYSIDEAFAQISRPPDYDLRPWSRQLRALIYQNLGLPISIGIGGSKSQAKIANYLAKNISAHAGVFDLQINKDQTSWLKTINIEDVWGIGPQIARWCRMRGINTAQQLRDMPSNELHTKFGVTGIRLQKELQGKVCLPLRTVTPPKQQTCVSKSFSRPITSLEELHRAINSHIIRASAKLRKHNQRAGTITVFTRTSPFSESFYQQSATTQLNTPSNDTAVLLAEALTLTEKIFRPYCLLVKAGVIMKKLQSTDHLQPNLLRDYKPESLKRRERLMQTIDKLNERYGDGTVKWAACVLNQSWDIRREQLSCYTTTRINQLPIVQS
ncbi:Y-family DNA polymerase [Prochlorococcus sp. MIT 1307]|uniref:Y-family DNA polymerase n=1 Tax=Prochlorococcus sp. MIT 1307 TaxID=3096219 RepID=UPI002A74A702|nr:Y-family DNA polymerase [Prochlorococcus sp. MIT 1307]